MYELVGVNKAGEQLFFEVVDYEDFVIDTLSETELLECLDMFEIKGVTHSQNKLYCNPEVEGRHSFKADFLAGFRGASYWVLSGTKADGRSFADLYSSKGKIGKLSHNLGEAKKIRVQVLWMNMTTMCFLLTSEVDKDGQPYISRRFYVLKNNKINCYFDTGMESKDTIGSFFFNRRKRSYVFKKRGVGTLRVYTLPC